ncbi:hypothetical protein RP20_CCG018451 [Aedes albopictus]|nr:hypothetical protein RP20_CCG018451 [Aedes albopictus]
MLNDYTTTENAGFRLRLLPAAARAQPNETQLFVEKKFRLGTTRCHHDVVFTRNYTNFSRLFSTSDSARQINIQFSSLSAPENTRGEIEYTIHANPVHALMAKWPKMSCRFLVL